MAHDTLGTTLQQNINAWQAQVNVERAQLSTADSLEERAADLMIEADKLEKQAVEIRTSVGGEVDRLCGLVNAATSFAQKLWVHEKSLPPAPLPSVEAEPVVEEIEEVELEKAALPPVGAIPVPRTTVSNSWVPWPTGATPDSDEEGELDLDDYIPLRLVHLSSKVSITTTTNGSKAARMVIGQLSNRVEFSTVRLHKLMNNATRATVSLRSVQNVVSALAKKGLIASHRRDEQTNRGGPVKYWHRVIGATIK